MENKKQILAAVELVKNDRVAEFVVLHLASRKNNANVTLTKTYENLMSDKKIKRPEITKCWKKFEAEGYGRFIEGKHGRESRFSWALPTKEFCQDVIFAL